MIFRAFLQLAAIITTLVISTTTVEAFWFLPLPGFGNDQIEDAREQAFGNGAVTSTEIPETSDTFPALSIPNTPPVGPQDQTLTITSPAVAEQETIIISDTRQNTEPSIENNRDFDLALISNSQARTAIDETTQSMSSHELDRVLSSSNFDPQYDLMDSAAQVALPTFSLNVFLEVEAGDTLSSLFQDVGISIVETQNAALALSEVFNLGALRPGQILELELDGAVEPFSPNRLQRLSLSLTNLELIEVVQLNGNFESRVSNVELNRVLIHVAGTLAIGSVYVDGNSMDVDGSVIANYVNALDTQVNFSRIQSAGDEIEMVYEAYFDEEGRLVDAGNVLYAAYADSNGDTYEAFRFETDGKAAYFTRDARFTGQTNTLLNKPVGGGRLTSRFGMRTHPIRGDRRMHNGTDYGATCGTPIYAAGDGTLSFAGWNGGYGRFISIRHGADFTTNYAHMKSFANGMRPGVRVRKGQLIGRVGTTGASTGCHLHYEVLKNGRHINPLSDHIPRGNDLTSGAKTRFLAFVNQLDIERENGMPLPEASSAVRAVTL